MVLKKFTVGLRDDSPLNPFFEVLYGSFFAISVGPTSLASHLNW
jgi:hypothetical protein